MKQQFLAVFSEKANGICNNTYERWVVRPNVGDGKQLLQEYRDLFEDGERGGDYLLDIFGANAGEVGVGVGKVNLAKDNIHFIGI
jgi:hypothetical protein